MHRSIWLLILLTLTHFVGRTCTCHAPDDFCETIQSHAPDIIILAVKTDSMDHGMQVDVIEVIEGTENRTTIDVWGDDGGACRVYTSNWDIGDTAIFGLYMVGIGQLYPQEDSTDYWISVCGVYHLGYQNGMVIGSIDDVNNQMSYSNFKALSCIALSNSGPELNSFKLGPNPATEWLEIDLGDFAGSYSR